MARRSARISKRKNSKGETLYYPDYDDANGVRRSGGTFKRKKDAEARLREILAELGQGVHSARGGSPTVAEAGKLWTVEAERDGLEASTVRQYRQHLNLHIIPHLGDVKLADLTAPAVRSFEQWLRDNGRSPAMVSKIVSSLGSLLAEAQEAGLVARNVVRERPKKRRAKGQAKRHKRKLEIGVDIPTAAEINAILAAVDGGARAIILTAARTGLRSSELRALRWRDVDFKNKVLKVRQRADRWNKIGALKSSAGQRDIPMSNMLANTLREWKLACPKSDLDLVFPNGSGNTENHGNIYARIFAPAWIAAGASIDSGKADKKGEPILRPKYGIHALRHFFASWLINEKSRGGLEVSLKRAQVLLGHSSLQMTADTYGHLLPAKGDESEEFSAGEIAMMA